MFKNLIIILAILLCTANIGSALVSISGTVSTAGSGLSGVTIDISGSGTTTNVSGYYIITGLAENITHTVTASKYQYVTNTLDVPVTTNDVTNADITLGSTSLSSYISKISQCVTSITAMFIAIMALFMEPPLVIFVGMGFFAFVIGIVARYMAGRRS